MNLVLCEFSDPERVLFHQALSMRLCGSVGEGCPKRLMEHPALADPSLPSSTLCR